MVVPGALEIQVVLILIGSQGTGKPIRGWPSTTWKFLFHLRKSLNFSVPLFSPSRYGDNTSTSASSHPRGKALIRQRIPSAQKTVNC